MRNNLDSYKLANKVTDLIFRKKGYDVKILDLRNLTTITDYFVLCSGDSDTQVKAIADEVDKGLRDEGINPWHKEGYKALNWILIDFVDVVVHVFKKDIRDYYNLEKLWGDAPLIDVMDPLVEKAKTPSPKSKKNTRK